MNTNLCTIIWTKEWIIIEEISIVCQLSPPIARRALKALHAGGSNPLVVPKHLPIHRGTGHHNNHFYGVATESMDGGGGACTPSLDQIFREREYVFVRVCFVLYYD